jgi:hypothetical protein
MSALTSSPGCARAASLFRPTRESEGSATAWIELHQAVWTHRKTFELASLLGVEDTYAAAHVIRLWSWALDNAPDGDLSHLSSRAVAYGAGWRGSAETLLAALVNVGWLNADHTIHDWHEYAGRLVERRRQDAERKRESRGHPADVRGMSNGTAAGVRRTVPDRTVPDLNRTGPDRTGPPPPAPPATAREGGGALPRAHTPRKEKLVLNGRDGPAGCPAGCPTNHGGPVAARHLGADWLAIPPDDRPAWPEFLTRHGRRDLADVPAPTPVQQEA